MLTIYHGSNRIIKEPDYDFNNESNDFGKGFYTSINQEMAKEWAVKNNNDGFLNEYILDTTKLDILDLSNPKYTILNWIACVLKHRHLDITSRETLLKIVYIVNNFYIDINKYDLVYGYRLDDSHYKIIIDFLNNEVSYNVIKHFFLKDNDSRQLVLISKKAFSRLEFINYNIIKNKYYSPMRINRDINLREKYLNFKKANTKDNDLYIDTILKEKITNGNELLY